MNLEIDNGRETLYQWDSGRCLIVTDENLCNEVHFVGSAFNEALVCQITMHDGTRCVSVPNILLQSSGWITAYLYTYAADTTQTRFSKSFYVVSRPKPASYIYEETEVLNYSCLAERIEQLETNGVPEEKISHVIEQYMVDHPVTPDGIGALSAEKLPEAVSDALAQAKASGEFKGDKGDQGIQGEKGEKGDTGPQGTQGEKGDAGETGPQGPQGEKGDKGDTGAQGIEGEKGKDGADGKTPVRGTDYWTDADKAEIKSYVDEAILGGAW